MKKEMDRRLRMTGRILADEPLPKIPLIEIADGRRVLIENHLGIVEYGTGTICVKVRKGTVCIEGVDLELACMAREKVVICGQITCVRLCRGGN